ncbi:MAG: DUF4255 domain-containing protein [Saonia sp.]
MFRTALEFIKRELDQYIVDREQDPANYTPGNVVDLLPVVQPNGDLNIDENAHVTLMLVGIEEERKEGKRPHYMTTDDSRMKKLNPPIDLNIFLLFIASNGNYETALRDCSSIVAFFQANPVFDPEKFPALNTSAVDPTNKPWQLIERLSFRLQDMSFEQQNNLWAMLGGKYIPSVVYKVNMLTVFETKSDRIAPAINEVNYNN